MTNTISHRMLRWLIWVLLLVCAPSAPALLVNIWLGAKADPTFGTFKWSLAGQERVQQASSSSCNPFGSVVTFDLLPGVVYELNLTIVTAGLTFECASLNIAPDPASCGYETYVDGVEIDGTIIADGLSGTTHTWMIEARPTATVFGWDVPKRNGRYVLRADGQSKATPSFESGSGALTWSITQGGNLASINSATGVVTSKTNIGGTIKIHATRSVPSFCYDDFMDLMPCDDGCSEGGCSGQAGGTVAKLNSVDVKIHLGWSFTGNSAGYMYIKGDVPADVSPTPAKLHYDFLRGDVHEIAQAGGLRQVRTRDCLADVITNSLYKYVISFYDPTNIVFTNSANAVYKILNTNYVMQTVTIENPTSPTTNTNTLRITITRDGASTVTDYNWITNGWEMLSGNGLRKETKTESTSAGIRTETYTVQEGAGAVVYQKIEKYSTNTFGHRLIEEVTGTGANALTNSYAWTASGYLQQVNRSDGSWEYYVYDSSNRPTNVFSSFRNQGVTTNRDLCRLLEHNYTTNVIPNAGDTGKLETTTPRRTIEFLLGQEIGRTYFVAKPDERREIRCVTAGETWSNAANLVTIGKRYTNGFYQNELQSTLKPDGTIEIFQYAPATVYSTNYNQTNYVLHGHPSDANGTNIDQGTRTEVVHDWVGKLLSKSALDVESGIVISRETYLYDGWKRATNTAYLDGTSLQSVYDCCGLSSQTARDGTITTYTSDDLKRVLTTTQNSIIRSNVYDANGSVLQTVRFGTTGTAITLSTSTFDDAGRLTSSQDALSNTTIYTNYLDGSGQPVRKTINADASTRIETYFMDGSLREITGTAVHPVQYDFGVESEGGAQRAWTQETRPNGSDTNQWTKAYVDMVGRTYKVSYSDGASSLSYFNLIGQLTNSVDPDGVSRLFQYDSNGELEYTAVNMDGSAGIGFSGTDRITRTARDVLNNGVADVQRTRTYVWPTSSDASNLISTVETSVDGLRSWNTIWNGGTPITSSNRTVFAGGFVIATNWAADGSYTVTTNQYGRALSVTRRDSAGAQVIRTSFGYDAHGRQNASTDARNGATTYTFNNADQVSSVTTPSPAQVTTNYFDSMARIWRVGLPDNTGVTNEFHLTGELKKTYGSRTYPVEYKYDDQGRMTNMTTWQNFAENSGTANTSWKYDAYRGFMTNKVYADAQGTRYTYTPAGRVLTRLWARGITTTYATNAAGEFATVAYSDSTPGMTNTYDRLGRLTSVVHGTDTTTMVYSDVGQLISETCNAFTVTNTYDSVLRRNSLSLAGYSTTLTQYGYDAASRLGSVTNGNYTATYAYHADSPLVNTVTARDGGTIRLTTTKSYDNLNRLTSVSNAPLSGSAKVFDYAYNSANQRTAVTNADSRWAYTYDSLGQVNSGKRYWTDGTLVAGQQFEYSFDDVGNRKYSAAGGDQWGANLRYSHYSVNDLNQYSSRIVPGNLDVLGTATNTSTVTVNDGATYRKSDYYRRELTVDNAGAAIYQGITNVAALGQGTNADIVTNIIGNLFLSKTPEAFAHDADGNLTNDGRWIYTWDAENRLVGMTNGASVPTGGRLKLDFTYDYRGRRTWKVISRWTGSGCTPSSTNRFAYDDWNLIAELDQTNAVVRTFVWGNDFSGTVQGGGGVGGLLAIAVTTNGTHFAGFDGNGNVSTLISASTGIQTANYDFGTFGESIRADGTAASSCPIRFSTKYQDGETDLLYYGYRYCNAATGRWLNRDPVAERGALNLYDFVGNNSLSYWDYAGLSLVDYQTICNFANEVERRMNGLNKNDGEILISLFLRLQHCILKKLCEGNCCPDPKGVDWINNVVSDFMSNLLHALDNEFDPNNILWKNELERIRKLNPNGDLERLQQGVAMKMAVIHINQDLRNALVNHGIGSDNDWQCVGKQVNDCERESFGRFDRFLNNFFMRPFFDVSEIRDQMRDALKHEQ